FSSRFISMIFFFFQAEDGIRDKLVTGVQTCALPISQVRLPQHLLQLAHLWLRMGRRLRETEVAHGDLQHGNVILVPAAGGNSLRSEERRVGKGCRSRWAPGQ